MKNKAKPYLVAVSGGIDSMVLLDMLVQAGTPLIVAHVDHGIRPDSHHDADFVKKYARAHNLQYVTTALGLGPDADEATARERRYQWLRLQQTELEAGPLLTAHHLDDVYETIFINLTRGTGWRGLCSLRNDARTSRPLVSIGMSKVDVVRYAIEQGVEWRDDSTNDDVRYRRNFFRHGLIGRLDQRQRRQLQELYLKQCELRQQIEAELEQLVEPAQPFARYPLIMVDPSTAEELIQCWLGAQQERMTLRRILHFARTAHSGSLLSLNGEQFIEASTRELFVTAPGD